MTWLGDSRAIIVSKQRVRAITTHDEVKGEEATAMIKRGGQRVVLNGSSYVMRNGVKVGLNVTRALGNKTLHPIVSDEAHVSEYDIYKQDTHVVVASDGVWKVLDNDQVANVIRNQEVVTPACVIEAASNAYKKKNMMMDDITVAIYSLHCEQDKSGIKRERDHDLHQDSA